MAAHIPALLAALALQGITDCSYPQPNCAEPYGTWLYQPTDDLFVATRGVPGATAVLLYSPHQVPAMPMGNGELCLALPHLGSVTRFDELTGQAALPFSLAEAPPGWHAQVAYRDCDSFWNLSKRLEIFETGVE